MNDMLFGSVAERLYHNRYDTDPELSHIDVDQAAARATKAGQLLVRVCPANVYSLQPDGSIGVMYAACLECGTCLAVTPPGVVKWHYPRGGKGIIYREG